MDPQKEALRRIINTLTNKNEELQHFLDSIDGTRTGLEEEFCRVMSGLEVELEELSSALEERGAQLRGIIKEEKKRKEAELQRQLSEGKVSLRSCQELLDFANQTLTITNEEEFLTAAKQIKERSATPSPNKTAGTRSGRERFSGESYTVLGDQEINGGCHYWELRPLADWKSLSVGVAYRGCLGRFDQLGKSASSWCLYASQWLQSSLAAKHNNRAKALDWPLPQRIGVLCDYGNGELMFVDVDQLRLLHMFKTKFSQALVPAFTVWCGGVSVTTGLQVPSFMGNFVSTNRSPTADQ